MLQRVARKLRHLVLRPVERAFYAQLGRVLATSPAQLYVKDNLGVLSRRWPTDNFEYLLRTGHSCDAVPMMLALDAQLAGELALDVGANIGITSVWMARRVRQVIAFEPETQNCKRLREQLAANHVSNVEVLPVAVSNRTGKATLHVHESYGHHSLGLVDTSARVSSEWVQTLTLDEFCRERGFGTVDFLKVDVEGFEQEVFEGAQQLFAERRIRLLAFEISRVPLRSLGRTGLELFDFLAQYGYQVSTPTGQAVPRAAFATLEHADLIARPGG